MVCKITNKTKKQPGFRSSINRIALEKEKNRMTKQKVYVAGHTGLAGTAVCKALNSASEKYELITATHAELDLENSLATDEFIRISKPDIIIVCAAKVGGIVANSKFPHDFLNTNLKIQTSIFDAAHKYNIEKLVFLGSSCIYPRECPQPISEDYLLTGPLEPTNRPYAIAKIAGVEAVWAYNRQFGRQWVCLMPTNLFGFKDNYHPEHSHVLPALLRRMHEAKISNSAEVIVWGTGSPKREFMFADELGDAIEFLLTLDGTDYGSEFFSSKRPPIINIGTGSDISIRELAIMISEVVEYKGNVVFDASRPDGTPRKLLDVSRLGSIGWKSKVDMKKAVTETYADFVANVKH